MTIMTAKEWWDHNHSKSEWLNHISVDMQAYADYVTKELQETITELETELNETKSISDSWQEASKFRLIAYRHEKELNIKLLAELKYIKENIEVEDKPKKYTWDDVPIGSVFYTLKNEERGNLKLSDDRCLCMTTNTIYEIRGSTTPILSHRPAE